MDTSNLCTWEGEAGRSEVQRYHQLHRKFKISLGSTRPISNITIFLVVIIITPIYNIERKCSLIRDTHSSRSCRMARPQRSFNVITKEMKTMRLKRETSHLGFSMKKELQKEQSQNISVNTQLGDSFYYINIVSEVLAFKFAFGKTK